MIATMLSPLAKLAGHPGDAGNALSKSRLCCRQNLLPLLIVSALVVTTSAVRCEAKAAPRLQWFVSAQRPLSFDPFVTASGNIAAVLSNPFPLDGTVADVQNVYTEIDASTGETISQKPQPQLRTERYAAVAVTAFADSTCVNASAHFQGKPNPLVAPLYSQPCMRYLTIGSVANFANFISCSSSGVMWTAYSDSSCTKMSQAGRQITPADTCIPIAGATGVAAIQLSCSSVPSPVLSIPGADAQFSKAGCFVSPALAAMHLQPCPSDNTTSYTRVSFRVMRSCMILYKCRANFPYTPRRNILVAVNSDATVAWGYSPSDASQPFFNDSNANFEYSVDPGGDVVTLQAFSSNNVSSPNRFALMQAGVPPSYLQCYSNGSLGYIYNIRPNVYGGLNVSLQSLHATDGASLFSASIRVTAPGNFEPCATLCIPSNVDPYSYFVKTMPPLFACNSPNYDKNTSSFLGLDNGGTFGLLFKQSATMGVRARKVACPASLPSPCYAFRGVASNPYSSECPNTLVLIGKPQLLNASIDLPPSPSPYSCPHPPVQPVGDTPFFVVTRPVYSQQTNLLTSKYSASTGLLEWQFNHGLLPQVGKRPQPAVLGLQVDWFVAGDPYCCDASLPCSAQRVTTQNIPLNECNTPDTYSDSVYGSFSGYSNSDECMPYLSQKSCTIYAVTVTSCSSSHAVVDVAATSTYREYTPPACPGQNNIVLGKRIPQCSINNKGYLMRLTCQYFNQSATPSKVYPSKTVIDDDGTVFYLSMMPLATSATRVDGFSVFVAAVSTRGLRLWTAQYDFPDSPIDSPFDSAPSTLEFNGPVQQLFAAFTDRILIFASPTLAPFAVDKGSGRETWRLSDPSGVSLLTVCTQFAVRSNGSAYLAVFGDCDGRMWAFDVSDAPSPPAPSPPPPPALSTVAPAPPPPTSPFSRTTQLPTTASNPSTSTSPTSPPITSASQAPSTSQPSSSASPITSSTASPASTAPAPAPATTSPSSTLPSSTSEPTAPQPFTSLPPVTIPPPLPPIILLLTTSFHDNWQTLADRLTQLLNCPTPLVFLGASQMFDGSWNVTMAVEVLLPPSLQADFDPNTHHFTPQPSCHTPA